MRKRPGLSGPIDDAFLSPFLVVTPTGHSASPQVDQWVRCELEFFQERWQSLFRGQLRIKSAEDVTAEDLRKYQLVVWGTPESNPLLARLLEQAPAEYAIAGEQFDWQPNRLQLGDRSFSTQNHVPVLIYPNPLAPEHYVVVNSGPTFRPAHDRTNSLQNPHLPDWAVISLDEPRSAESPGKVVNAGFFDDDWQWSRQQTW